MLKIDGKTFMNIQEAVQWLLENNALPFQCTANYAPLTEIGLGTIVNPTPAKVRIGSLIFFADSKVSTVVGITETGFICSDQYNDLVDDVVYVSNVAINASGHLIVTLSNGNTIDAGLIKQVISFSINASQHLIVAYNDGTTTDLGAIFSGDITISGDLTVAGTIHGVKIENIKDASGHFRFPEGEISSSLTGITKTYGRWGLSGTHLIIVLAGTYTAGTSITEYSKWGTTVGIPSWIIDKIYPQKSSWVDYRTFDTLNDDWSSDNFKVTLNKIGGQLEIQQSGNKTFAKDGVLRIAFDLFIDNQ